MFKGAIHFFKSLIIFLMMYKEGFWFSKNDHWLKTNAGLEHWGFYRMNWKKEHSIADIDFSIAWFKNKKRWKRPEFFHIHLDHKPGFRMEW